VIGAELAHKARALVVHYFFPAERNYMVEVVPAKETKPEVTAWTMAFYEHIGKVPVQVCSRYGYAVDPVFEWLFLAAALCVEEGLATTKGVDAVAARTLGLTVGPFTAMNLTGGNPITVKGLPLEGEKIMPWFRAPQLMLDAIKAGTPWDVPARGELIEVQKECSDAITQRIQGAYLGLCDEILSSGIINLADFELALEMGLDMKGPARLANELGLAKAVSLINAYADANPGFKRSSFFANAASSCKSIEVPVVLRHDEDGVAILTIRRPKSLNSLDDAAFQQNEGHLLAIKSDASVTAVVLKGFGTKAFVSGADVRFLSRIDNPETGMKDSRHAQKLTLLMEALGKPMVCAMNGLAFGGGMELAMACTTRIATKGLKVLGAQPEVNLGIIPGAGGTQRLPRWIGIEKASELLRTGRTFSGSEAKDWGLILEEVDAQHLTQRAIELAKALAKGTVSVSKMVTGPMDKIPSALPSVDIGHRSKAIDALLCRAILEGAARPLAEGLALENTLFGEVCKTKDMRIGINTFLEKGPREKAAFIHA
jgi:enoyl-CoA hydratase/3-hydroxyacyl-CoA dehydrogenase